MIDEIKIWTGEDLPQTTTTTTITTTTTTVTTTTTIPSGEGFFERTLSDIGDGLGSILSNLKDPIVKIILSVGLVGVCLFMFYIIAEGMEKSVKGKR